MCWVLSCVWFVWYSVVFWLLVDWGGLVCCGGWLLLLGLRGWCFFVCWCRLGWSVICLVGWKGCWRICLLLVVCCWFWGCCGIWCCGWFYLVCSVCRMWLDWVFMMYVWVVGGSFVFCCWLLFLCVGRVLFCVLFFCFSGCWWCSWCSYLGWLGLLGFGWSVGLFCFVGIVWCSWWELLLSCVGWFWFGLLLWWMFCCGVIVLLLICLSCFSLVVFVGFVLVFCVVVLLVLYWNFIFCLLLDFVWCLLMDCCIMVWCSKVVLMWFC